MHALASAHGYCSPLLFCGPAATARAFVDAFRRLTASLADGDMLLVTFAGHGRRLWGRGGAIRPHALCLADRLLTDAEVGALLDATCVRARVVIVLDACGSGGFLGEWIAARTGRAAVSVRAPHASAREKAHGAADVLVLAASPARGFAAAARARGAVPPFTNALLRCRSGCPSWTDLRDRMAAWLACGGFATPLLAGSSPALAWERPFRIAPGPIPEQGVPSRNPALPFGR